MISDILGNAPTEGVQRFTLRPGERSDPRSPLKRVEGGSAPDFFQMRGQFGSTFGAPAFLGFPLPAGARDVFGMSS